jgi:signal transduction histidine kinase
MRLQSEVIHETLNQEKISELKTLSERMIEDAVRLENELDKILQLSRVQLGGRLSLGPIKFPSFLHEVLESEVDLPLIKLDGPAVELQADRFALTLIYRNLIDNSRKHAKSEKIEITHSWQVHAEEVRFSFTDNGAPFEGEINKIGKLFYKFQSTQGSGIGLYLARKLIEAHGGKFFVSATPQLKIEWTLPRQGETHENLNC